jgi:phage minor structural protein
VSYPILYSSTETNFDNNGLGILSDCVSCFVTEEANGIFELEMQYPMDGIHYSEILDRSIIKAKPDRFRDHQLFRVYHKSKPLSGIVSISAQHISYDLSGIPVSPFEAESASHALQGLKNNAVVYCPFEFWTDKSTSGRFNVSVPSSIRSNFGGSEGSILDVYGGEFEFDNFIVKLHQNRGTNRGVSIRYGKNLTDIKQDENCANVATGIYPYWANQEGKLVELPEKIINAEGNYNFVRVKTVDFSQEFEEAPTVENLRTRANRYITSNKIGVPDVSTSVSFAQLEQSIEYKGLKLLEHISLFDYVNVVFPALGVQNTAKAVRLVYNVILDRVESITLGSVKQNIAGTIATQTQEIEKKPSISNVQKIASAIASSILGANGGAIRLLDTNGDGKPDELYVADNEDPAQAVKVWRWNYQGWAGSKNGYNGPFELGATLEDGILANAITAANLVAGTIKSSDGKTFFLDLDNGILEMEATKFKITGKTLEEKINESTKDAIYSTVDEFYLSVSPSFLGGGSWSTQQPEWTEGWYLWRRSKVTKGDGTVTYTPSENGVCITGNTGAPGAPGSNGADAIVCRIDSSTGYTFKLGETATLTARIFVGQEEIDPNGESSYTWYRRIDGGDYQAFANGKTVTVSADVFTDNMDVYFVCGIEEQVENSAVVGKAIVGIAIVGKGDD